MMDADYRSPRRTAQGGRRVRWIAALAVGCVAAVVMGHRVWAEFVLPPLEEIGIDESLFQPTTPDRTPRSPGARYVAGGGAGGMQKQDPGEDLPALARWDRLGGSTEASLFPGRSPLFTQPRVGVYLSQFEIQRANPEAIGDGLLQSAIWEEIGEKSIVDSLDLEHARVAVAQKYADEGFFNSTATLPDQEVTDGVVKIDVVEGWLSDIQVRGNRWLHDRYIERRIRSGADVPLNIDGLREPLARLHQHPVIRKLDADLRPGLLPGESQLLVEVDENFPIQGGVEMHNRRPPSVGEEQIEFWLTHTSLTRNGDILDLRYGLLDSGLDDVRSTGLRNYSASYSIPISRNDTTLFGRYSRQSYSVIEEPFADLESEGDSTLAQIGIRHPVWRSERTGRVGELALGMSFDRHRSETTLLGVPFSLTAGAVEGETEVSVLRFSQEFTMRNSEEVLALRSTQSVGLNVFDVTDDGTERDSEFLSWLGEGQYVRRLGETDAEIVLRGSFQLANDPLLSLEQYSVGGAHTVRGYRENQLVRDMGYHGSMELRIPILHGRDDREVLTVVPFVDAGGGWNKEFEHALGRSERNHESIVSAGVGLHIRPTSWIDAEIYWGHAFSEFESGGDNLQDRGIHFRLKVGSF